jgi:predicted amidophosphoribosyltransferase
MPQTRTTIINEQRSNVIDSFTCLAHRLRDNIILLIEDVSTSRVTLDACAIIPKPADATSIRGLVLAKGI